MSAAMRDEPSVCGPASKGEAGSFAPVAYTKREIELDFLRGIAILMVLDFHAPNHWLSYPFHLLHFPNFGWAGVNIFFVLSGFLVGGLLIREWRLQGAVDCRRFLIRRGLKIWPQYYAFLGLMLVTGHRGFHALWGNLLNVQNYVGGIPHTWSLAVEEHAYLLLALLLMVVAKRQAKPAHLAIFLGSLALAVSLARLLLITLGKNVVTQTHTRVEGILYGVLLAMLYHYRPDAFRRLQQRSWIWLGVVAVSLVFLRYQTTAPWATSLGWDAADLLGIALLMLIYTPSQTMRPALYRTVASIGFYSYGIYLWHVSVIAPVLLLSSRLPHWLVPLWIGLLPIAGGITLGVLFTKAVEIPVLKFRDKLYPRRVDSPLGVSLVTVRRGGPAEIEPTPQTAGA